MDTQRLRQLIDKRDDIDREIADIVTGNATTSKKAIRCSACNQEGHTARTCPRKLALDDVNGGGVNPFAGQ